MFKIHWVLGSPAWVKSKKLNYSPIFLIKGGVILDITFRKMTKSLVDWPT